MTPGRSSVLLVCWLAAACNGNAPADKDKDKDPDIVPRPDNLRENRGFLSPPLLQYPIYACASSVVVQGFVPGARVDVFADANPVPIGSVQSWLANGQLVTVNISFTVGQKITAKQTFGGATSQPSNEVPVTNYRDDYPAGLPTPRISPVPCYDCGQALGIADTVPGSAIKVFMEKARSGGGFDPPVQIGTTVGGSYAITTTPFVRSARLHVEASMCMDNSPPSAPEIVQPEPSAIPKPLLDPIHEGVQIVVVRGPGGTNPLNGAALDVFSDPGNLHAGGQPTPGGAAQQVAISPAAPITNTYRAIQALCTKSVPSDPGPVIPCAQQPPAKIKPPLPGDLQVEVTQSIPGARILVFAGGVEIGDGGAPIVVLSRPLMQGEVVVVLQRIGNCDSATVHQTTVGCALGGADACAADWPAFRHDGLRNGTQAIVSQLADPYLVKKLAVAWRFPATGAVGAFRASAVVRNGRVFVGSSDGHMYALDAATGGLIWQYPAAGQPALLSQYSIHSNPSGFGIASSAFLTSSRERELVIFAAPDPSVGGKLGSGRLFALRASDGVEVWKSPELARLTGLTATSTSELHEQFGYSSPLVLGDRVYAGIADHGDNPIQRGRVVAVNLSNGQPVPGFVFESTNTRGGGIWSALAGGLEGAVYATTGNARCWNGGCQGQPGVNHALSMLRLNANTGALDWKLQPVPFDMDDDPDWATGVQLVSSSCGNLALSTMKDGWSYAARTTGGPAASVRWQFPATGVPFSPGDGTAHGDTRYLHAGAVWSDVFFTETGGEGIVDDVAAGYGRLHALNVCAGNPGRVRWTVDIPGASLGNAYQFGSPSVTRGIVFVGTSSGRLVALADPSRWPAQASRCSRPDVSNAACASNGFSLVPVPTVLRNIPLGVGGIRGEPALAGNRVFVATEGGVVLMLQPRP
jgi:outer membrane protein assembly factor BamB